MHLLRALLVETPHTPHSEDKSLQEIVQLGFNKQDSLNNKILWYARVHIHNYTVYMYMYKIPEIHDVYKYTMFAYVRK